MKKLLGIAVLGLLLSGNAYADGETWKCQKISSKNYKCKTQRGDMKIEYLGETKNNLPHGKGKFQVLNDDIYAEGTFKDGEHVSGLRIMFGIKIYLENNKKIFKAVYPDGAIFIGKKSVVKIDGKESELNGTLTFNNGTVFKGSLKHVFEPTPIKGRETFITGAQAGNTFTGTFFITKTSHVPKEGKYVWGKKNNKDHEYFKGHFRLSGSQSFMSRGVLQLRSGDRYEGTFKGNNRYNKGTFYYASGAVIKYNNGQTTTVKSPSIAKQLASKPINIINYLNLYNILGLVIIGSFLLHLNANKQLYSGKKKFNLIEAIKSFMDTPLGGAILLLILAIILFKVFNAAVSTDLGRPRFFGHDGG